MREARNCNGKNKLSVLFFEWAPKLTRCPWSVVDLESRAYFDVWFRWKVFGVLPYPGDLLDQPCYLWQAIELIELLAKKREQDELKAASKGTSKGGTGE